MRQCANRREAQVDILLHKLADKVSGLLVDTRPSLSSKNPIALLHLGYNLLIATVEGRRSAEHNIGNHANAPNVTLLRIVSCDHFGGDIVWRTIKLMHDSALIAKVMRGAKVYHFYLASIVGVNEDVLGLLFLDPSFLVDGWFYGFCWF